MEFLCPRDFQKHNPQPTGQKPQKKLYDPRQKQHILYYSQQNTRCAWAGGTFFSSCAIVSGF
jgi:hypothetical protein